MTLATTIISYEPRRKSERLFLLVLFGVLLCIAQAMGHATEYGMNSMTVICPGAGVLGAALTLTHPRRWASLIAVSIVLDVAGNLIRTESFAGAHDAAYLIMRIFMYPTMGVVFALILRRQIENADPLSGPRALGVYAFVAIGINVAVVSFIGWAALGYFYRDYEVMNSWKQSTYCDITGLLAFGTPLIVMAHRPDLLRFSNPRRTESLVLIATTMLLTFLLFGISHGKRDALANNYQLMLLLPLFAWVVARFGPVMMTLVASILAQGVLLGMTAGRGPFQSAEQSDMETVLMVQGILVPGMLALLFISALLESQRKQYEKQIETEHRLRNLDRIETLGTMAGGVAHDFGNMAIAIRAYQSILQRMLPNPSEPVREAIIGLGEIADGTQSLTRSLMTFARDEEHDGRTGPMISDLGEVVLACTSALKPLVSRKLHLAVRVPEHEKLFVGASSGDLQRLLSNLIINASDASEKGATIEVVAESQDQYAVLTVRDQGKGMTPDVAARVLDPFYTTKPRGKGTGLGLAVVSGVVDEMNGMISIESAPDKGTLITIKAPIVDPPREPEPELKDPDRVQPSVRNPDHGGSPER